jgi:hypothetical protein
MVVALTGSTLADEMYRWKDSSGGLHFENVPTPERKPRGETAEVPTGDIVADQGGGPIDPSLYGSGDVVKKKKMTEDEEEAFSTEVSSRRSQLERDLRGTEGRIRQIDGQLATLARARTKNTHGSAATGGVGAPANILSPEEDSLVDERDELAQHAVDVRNDAAELRQEVEARLGTVPAWWTDIR